MIIQLSSIEPFPWDGFHLMDETGLLFSHELIDFSDFRVLAIPMGQLVVSEHNSECS